MDNKLVKMFASKVGLNGAQKLRRWGLQPGCVLLTKPAEEERLKTNRNFWKF